MALEGEVTLHDLFDGRRQLIVYRHMLKPADPSPCAGCSISTQLGHELNTSGQYLASAPLYPVAMATSTRVRDGKRLITDGPFAGTSEQLGGDYLIDVPNLDESVAFADRLPPVKEGTVEIRHDVE